MSRAIMRVQKTPFSSRQLFEETPNDLVVASVARDQGIDYVLRGEVIQQRHAFQSDQG